MSEIRDLKAHSFEISTGHTPRKGETVVKVVLLEHALKFVEEEKSRVTKQELESIKRSFEFIFGEYHKVGSREWEFMESIKNRLKEMK